MKEPILTACAATGAVATLACAMAAAGGIFAVISRIKDGEWPDKDEVITTAIVAIPALLVEVPMWLAIKAHDAIDKRFDR